MVTEARRTWMANYSRNRYATRRAMLVDLLGGKCEICGTTDDLEIDHRNRTDKQHSIGNLIKGKIEVLLAEASKCQLLCDLCHNRKSSEEASVEHGGGRSGKKNCKCQPCRTRKNEYMRQYKKARRRHASVAQLVA